MSTDTREVLAAAKSALGQLIEAGKAVKAALDANIPDGDPVHPESRRLTWPISSGLLALDAVDAALATQPAQPTPTQIAAVEKLTQQSQKMGFYGECQMRLGIGRCECQESGLGDECIYRLRAPKPAQFHPETAWLVEWKAHGYGPQWWGFNHTPGKSATWCSDANNAIRFARKEDAERMRLHIIAVAGLTGMHEYERNVSVTEHLWPSLLGANDAQSRQPNCRGRGRQGLLARAGFGRTSRTAALQERAVEGLRRRREHGQRILGFTAMSTDTREALAALAEIEEWFEKRESVAGDLGALDEQLEMAGLAGRVAGIRAALATQPAQPSAQGEAVAHPSHQTVRDWMPVSEALRLAGVWSAGDLDNCGQWRAAIKVLADEVRALASAPAAPAQAVPLVAKPLDDYHEDMGAVLWWCFPIEEAPYCGNPNCDNWPGYHTHWTPLQIPADPTSGIAPKAAP